MLDEADNSEYVPDECVIVRGGIMAVRDLVVSAVRCFDQHGFFAWSFWGRPGATADEVARTAPFPHSRYRASTAARLRDAGFEPEVDHIEPGDDHIQVRLQDQPDEPLCERLRDAFDLERPRPE